MITLSSDFGTPYPAAMKGIILSACGTDTTLVDVRHEFPRQDVRSAAFWLREVLPWFPPAVHLVVVDPGVGTDRDALAVRAGEHALVGPDNGVLLPAARELAPADDVDVFTIAYDDPGSATFHGRDVFAPAAAAVHEADVDGIDALDRTDAADDFEDLRFPNPDADGDRATGEVLAVDGFGNVITNLPGDLLADRWDGTVAVDGERAPVARSYAHVDDGQRLVTVGSHGNVEFAVNRGRGDEAFGVGVEDTVRLELG